MITEILTIGLTIMNLIQLIIIVTLILRIEELKKGSYNKTYAN